MKFIESHFRLLHPRDNPGGGEGAGAEVHPRHGQAPRPAPGNPSRPLDRRVCRYRGGCLSQCETIGIKSDINGHYRKTYKIDEKKL